MSAVKYKVVFLEFKLPYDVLLSVNHGNLWRLYMSFVTVYLPETVNRKIGCNKHPQPS